MCYAALQNLVGLQPDGISKLIIFQIIKQFRNGESRICTQIFAPKARPAVAFDDGLKYILPIICAMNIAGTKSATLQVAVLVEDEQRMIAVLGKVAVIGGTLLRSVNRTF